MNLHDVVKRALRGTRFEHSAVAWARVVRASEGKAHLYQMPVKNGRLACTVWANVYGDMPTPECGAKPRNTPYPFSRMYSENAGARPWSNYCRECVNIERTTYEGALRYNGYWGTVMDEAGLATFYATADRDAVRP